MPTLVFCNITPDPNGHNHSNMRALQPRICPVPTKDERCGKGFDFSKCKPCLCLAQLHIRLTDPLSIIRFVPLLIIGLIVVLIVIFLVGWLVVLVVAGLAGLGVLSVATADALRRALLAPVVFLYRLTCKIFRRQRAVEPFKRARITPLSEAEVRSFHTSNNPGLQVLLLQQKGASPYMMLVYSHHADYMRLFGLSKYVRQVLRSSVDHGVENIRKMTCNDGEKSECWACRGQICSVSRDQGETHA